MPRNGKLLGHTRLLNAARNEHLAGDSVRESAARVATSIDVDILRRARAMQLFVRSYIASRTPR